MRRPTAASLGIVTLIFTLADWGSMHAGNSTIPGGPLDEIAHLATAVIVLWALGTLVPRRLWVPALIGSVAIDIDHLPGRLGINWLTAGTPRPYTHSLLLLALLLVSAQWLPRGRNLLRGAALGVAIHLFRDLDEPGNGVSLLWPFSYHAFTIPHAAYVAVMLVLVTVCAVRVRRANGELARRRTITTDRMEVAR